MERAADIAIQSRRFRVLSQHPEIRYAKPADRAKYVSSNAAWNYLDVILVGSATESDVICAEAIVQISDSLEAERMGGDDSDDVFARLDLLSLLSPDRLIAIYYALPEGDRAVCSSHYVWASHLNEAPDEVGLYLEEIASLGIRQRDFGIPLDIDEDIAEDYAEFTRENLRREMGLPHTMGPKHTAIADLGVAFREALYPPVSPSRS